MKKLFLFAKENPLFVLLSLVSIALYFFEESTGGVLMAMATVVAPGSPSPSKGIAGYATHGSGEATTVSNASELGGEFIQPEIDSKITMIASDESIIDTIKRRITRQVPVTSFEVDHYLIDEKRSKATTSAEYMLILVLFSLLICTSIIRFLPKNWARRPWKAEDSLSRRSSCLQPTMKSLRIWSL